MKIYVLIIGTITGIIAAGIISCNNSRPAAEHQVNHVSRDSIIRRGEYLVTIMGCNDCHTPKKMGPNGPELDSTRLLSGHPSSVPIAKIDTRVLKDWVLFYPSGTSAVGPWGVSFAGNLTSDSTGIGAWKEEQFIRALRYGKYKGLEQARQLLPPMPWPVRASDDDLKAIFAYLKSTKPVKNVVPPPIPLDMVERSK